MRLHLNSSIGRCSACFLCVPSYFKQAQFVSMASSSTPSKPKLRSSKKLSFGTTHVIQPKGEHRATVVWLHGLGDVGARLHWDAVKSIMRYLKGTKNKCLCYGKGPLELKGFCDSDMAGDVDTRKSTSGYVFTLARGAVSWCSKLQKIVASSTTEAEYISATEASKEAIWLARLCSEFG
ncbi:hypothetical protein L7F22_016475 [Adiantum nelumboides]|nr:hypothetical protein [Adiantum nelumboides]